MSGRISSQLDQMIEIQGWKETIIQISAFVMAVSNYNQSFVNITIIDLKMRRQNLVKTFNTSRKPTKLYQIDENNLLVGTEGGKIEHWVFNENACKKIYDAHPESDAGISAIIELKSNSELLRGGGASADFKLIATASSGAKEFRMWKLQLSTSTLMPYLKIETTFTDGIKYLLETTDTQLVAANESTIKFYDFIDKTQKAIEENKKKEIEAEQAKMKEIFQKIDVEHSEMIKKTDLKAFIKTLGKELKSEEYKFAAEASDEGFEDVWFDFDTK